MTTVAIIGGGLAGIGAAVALAEAGLHVTIYEKRPLLGGRASSFVDGETGERRDECQHGTMRCCTNLGDLLHRLGVADEIQWFGRLEFLDGDGKRSVIENCGLPAPLHTSLSFLRFRSLGVRDKIGIGQAMLRMLRARPDAGRELVSAAHWLKAHGQTERAIRRFWRPILVSACNEELDCIAASYLFQIFRDGFLLHPTAFHFGVPRRPLGSLYHEPTLAYLQARGGQVHTRTIVNEIAFMGGASGRVTGFTLQNGERVEADYYVSGLQCDLLLKMLPPEITAGVAYWENLRGIELSPIAGVHLWFDRVFACPPALAILDRDTEWIFNKNQNFALTDAPGTYLSMVISASHRFAGTSKEELTARVLAEVRACVPGARDAQVVKSSVVRWPKATIAPAPGVNLLRPDQQSPLANLFVAGEWTQTGWPSTMEGAVRSGYRVAELILEREGKPQTLLAPGLPPSGLARWLDGGRTTNGIAR